MNRLWDMWATAHRGASSLISYAHESIYRVLQYIVVSEGKTCDWYSCCSDIVSALCQVLFSLTEGRLAVGDTTTRSHCFVNRKPGVSNCCLIPFHFVNVSLMFANFVECPMIQQFMLQICVCRMRQHSEKPSTFREAEFSFVFELLLILDFLHLQSSENGDVREAHDFIHNVVSVTLYQEVFDPRKPHKIISSSLLVHSLHDSSFFCWSIVLHSRKPTEDNKLVIL